MQPEARTRRQITANVVVSGLGGLHLPNRAAIDGIESFGGARFRTAEWDHSQDLKGRRALFGRMPWLMRLYRWFLWLMMDVMGTLLLRRNSWFASCLRNDGLAHLDPKGLLFRAREMTEEIWVDESEYWNATSVGGSILNFRLLFPLF